MYALYLLLALMLLTWGAAIAATYIEPKETRPGGGEGLSEKDYHEAA